MISRKFLDLLSLEQSLVSYVGNAAGRETWPVGMGHGQLILVMVAREGGMRPQYDELRFSFYLTTLQ